MEVDSIPILRNRIHTRILLQKVLPPQTKKIRHQQLLRHLRLLLALLSRRIPLFLILIELFLYRNVGIVIFSVYIPTDYVVYFDGGEGFIDEGEAFVAEKIQHTGLRKHPINLKPASILGTIYHSQISHEVRFPLIKVAVDVAAVRNRRLLYFVQLRTLTLCEQIHFEIILNPPLTNPTTIIPLVLLNYLIIQLAEAAIRLHQVLIQRVITFLKLGESLPGRA